MDSDASYGPFRGFGQGPETGAEALGGANRRQQVQVSRLPICGDSCAFCNLLGVFDKFRH